MKMPISSRLRLPSLSRPSFVAFRLPLLHLNCTHLRGLAIVLSWTHFILFVLSFEFTEVLILKFCLPKLYELRGVEQKAHEVCRRALAVQHT